MLPKSALPAAIPEFGEASPESLTVCGHSLFWKHGIPDTPNAKDSEGAVFSHQIFYKHQKNYVIPVVVTMWKQEQDNVTASMSNLEGGLRKRTTGVCT